MRVNPNDLLIFKLRGMGAQPSEEVPAEEEIKPIVESRSENLSTQESYGSERKEAPKPKTKYKGFNKAKEEALKAEVERKYAESLKSEAPSLEAMQKTILASKKSSVDIGGMQCATHPWRKAYAKCDYCDRTFCYADIVKKGNKFYCLEDIDKVSNGEEAEKDQARMSIPPIAGIGFIINALLIGYFTYPQISYLISSGTGAGALSVLNNFTYAYQLAVLDIIVFTLSATAGLFVITKSNNSAFTSAALGVLVLLGASYEFLNSFSVYLLAITALAIINIGVVSYLRVNPLGAQLQQEESNEISAMPNVPGSEALQFSRLETF